MKNLMIIALVALSVNAMAQNKTQQQVNKINTEIYKVHGTVNGVNSTVNGVNNAAQETKSTINDTKQIFEGVGNFLRSKKEDKKEEQKQVDNNVVASTSSVTTSSTTATSAPTPVISNTNQTSVTVSNIDYMGMKVLSNKLKENNAVGEIATSMAGNVATLIVHHSGNTEALVDYIMSQPNNKLSVNSFANGTVQLSLK